MNVMPETDPFSIIQLCGVGVGNMGRTVPDINRLIPATHSVTMPPENGSDNFFMCKAPRNQFNAYKMEMDCLRYHAW